MGTLRINLFGSFTIAIDERPLFVGIPHTKPLELFAYLLIHRAHTHPREAVATLLWPELTPPQAKKNLRKVLCTLQHFLTSAREQHDPPVLLIDHDWVALNPALELELDAATFEEACTLGQQYSGAMLDSPTAQVLADAAAIYRGELLTGLYADWCLYERERLENMYLELCHLLLLHTEQVHTYEQAIQHGLEILRHDRANERAHRDLMRLYCLSGNRSAALRQYGHCVESLARELGVKPSKSTEQLYRNICQDELSTAAPASVTPNLPHIRSSETWSHSNLQQVRAELQRMLHQVQDEIRLVDGLLQR